LTTLLLFYRTPSHTERILYTLTLLFTFTSAMLIVIPSGTRSEELWAGVASAIFTVLVAGWCIICNRTVQYGVRHEERRLTGARQQRTWKQVLSVFSGSIVIILILAVSVLFTINLSILARDRTLPTPGGTYPVENGQYSVHLFCAGNKTDSKGEKHTTVLLEGGHEPVELRLESWVRESHERNHTAVKRYCYWDRPGYAFSSNAPSPMSAGRVADALSEALVAAGEEGGPWVLVSHGVGGIYSRIFAARHPGQVKGMMLIDALPESLLYRIGGAKRGLLLWLRGVLYPLGLDRIWATWFLGRSREDRVYGRDAYMQGGEIKAKLQESLVATSFTKNEIIAAAAILPRDTPLVVVSSGRKVKNDRMWSDGQRQLTRVSDELVSWDVVEGAHSEIWRDNKGRVLLEKRLVQLLGGA
jgi:pimeloyl-ACP methyl ester carboxylesterase